MAHETYAHAAARPLALKDVSIGDGFWRRIVDVGRTTGLPAVLTEYEGRNIVKNFIAAAADQPRATEENAGNYDEFLFKALEACNYYVGAEGTDALREQYERIRDAVLAAQEPDGYLNTLARQTHAEHHSDQTHQELYAGGHLMEAGLAELRNTDNTVLFDAARRYIDCLIEGYGLDGARLGRRYASKWPDHPNVEMALVELYRATGDEKYLTFCDSVLKHSEYRARTQMLNHAVCETLHCTGGADYYLETGDQDVWAATRRLWDDMLAKVYVTGAIGSVHTGATSESVGKAHALTNDQCYTETCASISHVFWSWRMFLATGDAAPADMMERALYNGVLGGMSIAGTEYFYQNPMEYRPVTAEGSTAIDDDRADFRGDGYQRKAWHNCSCCPPNVQRLLASVQQYIYATSEKTLWVALYVDSAATVALPDGASVRVRQETDYPAGGKVRLTLGLDADAALAVRLRVPAWCVGASVAINGETIVDAPDAGEFLTIDRAWSDGDVVELDMPMEARLVQCHPQNVANYAKLVIARGPIVYCMEGHDNPGVDLFRVVLPTDVEFDAIRRDDLLGGIVTLTGEALLRDDAAWDPAPYQTFDPSRPVPMSPVEITAIPYYAWANRGRSAMVTAFPYVLR
jgi:hypothetical protein